MSDDVPERFKTPFKMYIDGKLVYDPDDLDNKERGRRQQRLAEQRHKIELLGEQETNVKE